MSQSEDEQASLDEFRTALDLREESDDDKPSWEPAANDEPHCGTRTLCEQCGAEVSADFARVFGNNDDELENGCPNCSTYREYTGATGFGSGNYGGQL